jgi:hypothetical protein
MTSDKENCALIWLLRFLSLTLFKLLYQQNCNNEILKRYCWKCAIFFVWTHVLITALFISLKIWKNTEEIHRKYPSSFSLRFPKNSPKNDKLLWYKEKYIIIIAIHKFILIASNPKIELSQHRKWFIYFSFYLAQKTRCLQNLVYFTVQR